MPSGAKKRKAAKKKKENQSNPTSTSSHSHADEDVKHQDDKGSDVGEVGSPASQDHHSHQNLLTEGEEEEIEKESELSNLHSVDGSRIDSGEKHIAVEETVVQVEREFKVEEESDQKDGRVEHDDGARKSYDGGSSGSSGGSSSSSDDENHGINNSQAAADIASTVDSVKVADSMSRRPVEAIHRVPIKEAGDSVVDNIAAVDSEKFLVSVEQVEVDTSYPADNSVAPYVGESVLKENGEKKPTSVEYEAGASVACMDAIAEEKAIVQSVENTATTPDLKQCVVQENDDRLAVPNNAPRATADNGAEHGKDSGVTEPLLVPSPGAVPKTSWRSCCGLFEVFTGSGR